MEVTWMPEDIERRVELIEAARQCVPDAGLVERADDRADWR
jgi:hypothetical protein